MRGEVSFCWSYGGMKSFGRKQAQLGEQADSSLTVPLHITHDSMSLREIPCSAQDEDKGFEFDMKRRDEHHLQHLLQVR